jgi:hypothetical protein
VRARLIAALAGVALALIGCAAQSPQARAPVPAYATDSAGATTTVAPSSVAPSTPSMEPTPMLEERSIASQHHEELLAIEAQADALSQQGDDCAAACGLAARICELDARICAIADRHTGDAELGARCVDSRSRCERGRSRVAARCGCVIPR